VKFNLILLVLSLVTFSTHGQLTETAFVSTVANDNRMSLVKANIPLSEWHEKSFWAQYNDYRIKMQDVSSLTSLAIQKLLQPDRVVDNSDAFDDACNLITYRFNELAVKRQYFIEISHEHNGIIALQFLQTESMLDMTESARIYQGSSLRTFRFLPKVFSVATLKQAKYNTITKALALSTKEAALFLSIYSSYEQECEDILGQEYDIYELFAVEASDFTPALSRSQGYDLLTLMNREIKLKEKYFTIMNASVGASLAARFLVWEDYYSIICKMQAWVNAQ
jgi:hypothetical protein